MPVAPGEFDAEALRRATFQGESGIGGSFQESKDPDGDDAEFLRGGDNTQFFQETQVDLESIVNNLLSSITRELASQGLALGWSPEAMQEVWQDNWVGALEFTDGLFQDADARAQELAPSGGGTDPQLGSQFFSTAQGFNTLVKEVWDYYRRETNFGLGALGENQPKKKGSGSRGRTAQDIRNSFDLDELAMQATRIWQRELLDEPDNARGMARSFVDAVVAGKGEKRIDFETFIVKRTEETARHASIYGKKPPAQSTTAFLQPYFAAAQQVVRPGAAAGIAIGGAQFGASANTFAQRLRRTDESTSSAPFIQELEGRLSALNGVFKG